VKGDCRQTCLTSRHHSEPCLPPHQLKVNPETGPTATSSHARFCSTLIMLHVEHQSPAASHAHTPRYVLPIMEELLATVLTSQGALLVRVSDSTFAPRSKIYNNRHLLTLEEVGPVCAVSLPDDQQQTWGSLQSSTEPNDWTHTVKADVIWCIFHSHGLRGVDDSSLGGIVPRQSSSRPETCCGSNCDERSSILLLLQIWHKHLSGQVDRSHIHSKHLVVLLFCDLTRRLSSISALSVTTDVARSLPCYDR
jgi:hypothetical protein